MAQIFLNNLRARLSVAVLAADTALTLVAGAGLPTWNSGDWMWVTLTQNGSETSWEIIKVTQWSTDSLDVVERGQQGTAAQDWPAWSKAENRIVQADAAAFASPYRLSSPDDRSYIEIYDDYTLWSIQDVTVFYSNGVSFTQFYCPGATALTSTGTLSIYAASGGLAFQTNVGGDIGFTAGYDPGTLPSGVLRMAGQKVEFRGQTMDLIPPFTIGGEPPIQLRFYRAFSSFTSVGFSASMTTDPAADVVWQLPGGDGTANQAMVTDGAGLLSWRTVLSTPAAANMVLTADGLGTFTAATSAELEDGYLTLSGAIGPGIYINGTGSLGGGEIYLSDDGSGFFTGALTASNLSGTNTGDQDLSGLQPLDAQLTDLAGLSYASNGGKFIRVKGTEDGFELASVAVPSAADPTATIGLTATNGVAATFMRSDAAPALSQSIAPTWTGVHTFQQAVAATSTDGLVLATSDTATSGNQKWSPRIRLRGSYFSGSAKTTDFIIENQPTASGGTLRVYASDNGGAYSFQFGSDGGGNLYGSNSIAVGTPGVASVLMITGSQMYMKSDAVISWSSGSNPLTPDTTLSRASAGVLSNTGAYQSLQAVATTSTDGFVLATSTAATSGNQKQSPRLRFRASGWGTTGGAAQPVDWIIEGKAIQGGNPTGQLQFRPYVNDVAGNVVLTLVSSGSYSGFVGGLYVTSDANDPYTGSYMTFDTTGIAVKKAAAIGWTSGSNGNGGQTTAFTCPANYTVRLGGGYAADTANPPNSMTFSVQDASGTNTPGALRYYVGSLATGNAASGGHAFQVGDPGASGSTLQTAATKLLVNTTGIVLPRTSGYGIKLDVSDPQWGWNDIIGVVQPKTIGAGTPTYGTYQGNIHGYYFVANDIVDFIFHIPHDYAPGTHMYIHVHWSHNGTAISGNAVFTHYSTYAKGHNQANFPAEVTNTITYATTDITTTPRYRHRVDEIQLSTTGGSASTLNTSNLEVDGVILMRLKLTTLPTITAGNLFIHTADIHYQSTGIPTKQKAPDFYAA